MRRVVGCADDGAQTIVIWRRNSVIDLLAVAPGESEHRSFASYPSSTSFSSNSDRAHLDYVLREITDTVLRCGQNLTVHAGVSTYHAEIWKDDDGGVTVDWSGNGALKYGNLFSAFRSSGLV